MKNNINIKNNSPIKISIDVLYEIWKKDTNWEVSFNEFIRNIKNNGIKITNKVKKL